MTHTLNYESGGSGVEEGRGSHVCGDRPVVQCSGRGKSEGSACVFAGKESLVTPREQRIADREMTDFREARTYHLWTRGAVRDGRAYTS
jgi:hypothetical protein